MSAVPCEPDESPDAGLALLLLGVERREHAALAAAQHGLDAALRATDRPVPCQETEPNMWLSDSAEQRLEATRRCRACPVMSECAAVADAVPPQAWGVFGGHDYTAAAGLAELRVVGALAVRGSAGAAARARRDELLVELGRTRRWTAQQLADTVGVSATNVAVVWRAGGVSGRRSAAELVELVEVNAGLLAELRAIGPIPRDASGDTARARRDFLLIQVWESDPGYWTAERLAPAAGVSRPTVRTAVRQHRRHTDNTQSQRRPDLGESRADRLARFRTEAENSDDPRVAWLLTLCRQRRELPVAAGSGWRDVVRDRAVLAKERADLMMQLWAEDPRYWTRERFAAVLDCADATVSRILDQALSDAGEGGSR